MTEKVKLLNKVKEEKEKNQSLATWQLAALVGGSKSTLHDWQKNEARLGEQYDEAVFGTLMLSYSVCFMFIFYCILNVFITHKKFFVWHKSCFSGRFYWLLPRFYCIIVKIGILTPCRVSLVDSDKPISPLYSDKNSRDQSVRIKRSRLY